MEYKDKDVNLTVINTCICNGFTIHVIAWRYYNFENKIIWKDLRNNTWEEKNIFIPEGWKLSCDTEQWLCILLYREPSFQKTTLLNCIYKTAYRNAKQVSG